MVRLGAVLFGSVMYGLVRLARLGRVLQVVVWNGLAWQVRFVVVRSGMAAQVVVWQERRGQFWIGGVLRGLVWFAMAGYKRR